MPKLTSKGQVTLPKRMREHLGLKPGSEIEFTINNQGEIVLRSKAKRPKSRLPKCHVRPIVSAPIIHITIRPAKRTFSEAPETANSGRERYQSTG